MLACGIQTIFPLHASSPIVYAGQVPEEQLVRQRAWLGDSWTWLLKTMVLEDRIESVTRPMALDVGCGPGLVMELLAPFLDVRGIDIDPMTVRRSNERGQEAMVAMAERLPFEDASFDIVYCSYLLLWVSDPAKVLREMARVSRDWVICLAEPDHLGRISYPPGVAELDSLFVRSLREQGADPGMGRRLQEVFVRCGLRPVTGVHSSMVDPASVPVLIFLSRNIARVPVMIVMAYDCDALENAPGGAHPLAYGLRILVREGTFEELRLGSLGRLALEKVLEEEFMDPLESSLAGLIWARSEGNPMRSARASSTLQVGVGRVPSLTMNTMSLPPSRNFSREGPATGLSRAWRSSFRSSPTSTSLG